MFSSNRGRILMLGAVIAILALVGACGSSDDPTATPRPAATPIPGATSTPQPTATPAPTATPEGMAKFGGVLIHGIRSDLAQQNDPMFRNAIPEAEVQHPLYGAGNLWQTCVEDVWDRSCNYHAESWDVNADFTVWTFKIRNDILWHDGVPLTNEDYVFWFDLGMNGAPSVDRGNSREISNYGDPSNVEALPDNGLRITLTNAIVNYPVVLADPAMILAHPKHLVEPVIASGEDPRPPSFDYVGAGPFEFVLYDKGSVVEVSRFDQYWEQDEFGRQLPYLDGIQFPIISDREAMVAAFRSGRLDTTGRGNRVWFLQEQIEATRKQLGDDAVVFVPVPSGYRTVGFHPTAEGPWQDERVRRAMMLAIDREAGGKAIYGEFALAAPLYFRGSPWQNPDYETWPGFNPATKAQDIVEAKRLMAEAGYADGFEFKMVCRAGAWVPECEFFAEELRKNFNITVALDVVDSSTRSDRQCGLGYEAIISGGSSAAKFPETVYAQVGSYKDVPCSSNFPNDDPKITELTDRILAAQTQEERIRIARELEKYVIVDKVYGITLTEAPYPFAHRDYVKGILNPVSNPNDLLDATRWWMDK